MGEWSHFIPTTPPGMIVQFDARTMQGSHLDIGHFVLIRGTVLHIMKEHDALMYEGAYKVRDVSALDAPHQFMAMLVRADACDREGGESWQ